MLKTGLLWCLPAGLLSNNHYGQMHGGIHYRHNYDFTKSKPCRIKPNVYEETLVIVYFWQLLISASGRFRNESRWVHKGYEI